jgi:hypothetical protein
LVEAGHAHIVCEKLCNAYLYEYETGEGLESQVEQSLVNASVGVHDKLGHQPGGAKGRGGLEGNSNLLAGIVEGGDAVRQLLVLAAMPVILLAVA